jgi:hypothetical protein
VVILPLARADRRTIIVPSTGIGAKIMIDVQQTQRINEAAKEFSDALGDAYQALTNRTVSTQEQQVAQLTQAFFEAVIEKLRAQAQGNQQMVQELVDQQQQQREAAQVPAQETSVKDYMRLLDYMCSYYRLLVASRSKRV